MSEQTHEAHDDPSGNGNGASPRESADSMFESLRTAAGDLAERAGPTVREFSARAADLTAVAAVKAAPLARKAGEKTADASTRLAELSRGWAADLRGALKTEAPSDAAADEPVVDTGPAPFESTAEADVESPAFDEGGSAPDQRESDTPGI